MAKLSKQTIDTILELIKTKGYSEALKEFARKGKKGHAHALNIFKLAAQENQEILKAGTNSNFPTSATEVQYKTVQIIPDKQKIVNKDTFKNTEADAAKWAEFVANKFCPFADYLESFTVPAHKPVKRSDLFASAKNKRVFVVCCFDWHMGARCDAAHSMSKKEWNSDECDKAVDQYIGEIQKMVANDKAGFERCIILWGGDLYHSFTGETTKGTQLTAEIVGEIQFDRIKNAMIRMVDGCLEAFDKVDNYFVKGNHGGDTDYGLGSTVAAWYRQEPRCNWEVSQSEVLNFIINDHAILLTHGASADSKNRFSEKRSAHNEQMGHRLFNQMFEEKNRYLKYKYIFVGDKHHSRQEECNGFELIQVGSMVKADKYASNMVLTSRPSQLVCIFDEKGCVSRNLVFFD